jgi:hypothetical protein
MRNATLISCNRAGVISTTMIWHDETNENEVVQLTIGNYKYIFNNEGKLQSSTEVQNCANIYPNMNTSCAQFPPISCKDIVVTPDDKQLPEYSPNISKDVHPIDDNNE